MADFTRLDDEDEVLEDAYADVAASIDSLRTSLRPLEGTLPTAAVDQTLTLCWERFGAAQRELREFEVELDATAYRSGLPGYTVRSRTSAHQARFEEQRRMLAKLRGSLEFFTAQRAHEADVEAEFGGGGGGGGGGSGRPIARLTPSEIIQQASMVQGQSQASVSRSVRLVQETRQVGAATVGQLGEQREQLLQVHHTAASLVDTLGQAEREARRYASGLFDDTAQLVCLTLILLGLTFAAIMRLNEVSARARARVSPNQVGAASILPLPLTLTLTLTKP